MATLVSAQKMEVVFISETLASTCKYTLRYNKENQHRNLRYEITKSY